ncbi:MAG: hypothetical protein QM582_04970, partial [Micropruina sp.]|uniref:hypothetical protein n=1 Tax=Micropruina sp. TaxID=2737536 RepID=UPI0039E3A7AF
MSLILDLAGYRPDKHLTSGTILDPAVGGGAFIGEAVHRLLASARSASFPITGDSLKHAVKAFDIDNDAVDATRKLVESILLEHGVDEATASFLAAYWIQQGD